MKVNNQKDYSISLISPMIMIPVILSWGSFDDLDKLPINLPSNKTNRFQNLISELFQPYDYDDICSEYFEIYSLKQNMVDIYGQ